MLFLFTPESPDCLVLMESVRFWGVWGDGDSFEGDRWVTLFLPDQPCEARLVITDPPDSNALRIHFPVMPLTSELRTSEHQTSFNFKRWRELLSDSDIARLPYRLHGC
jgi:hypothetical protein